MTKRIRFVPCLVCSALVPKLFDSRMDTSKVDGEKQAIRVLSPGAVLLENEANVDLENLNHKKTCGGGQVQLIKKKVDHY